MRRYVHLRRTDFYVDMYGSGGLVYEDEYNDRWLGVVQAVTIWNQKKKKMTKDLDAQGFNRNQTFYGSNQTVVVDVRQGKVALLFFWNPFELFVLSAGCITKAWTEDGAGGVGFLRGTSRVSFLFLVDSVKVRVATFISNQRWKMDDPKILEAVSKADMMVQVLDAARQASVE